ncbi:hypothetical protein APHAL10511_000653 [Amanita phalloides]|nr:hypothetical protein APHAL10511_000653 [Amanita phalloides]
MIRTYSTLRLPSIMRLEDPPPTYNYMGSSPEDTNEHPEHFTRDVYFEVEGTRFKFPIYYLDGSSVFKRLINGELPEKEAYKLGITGDGIRENPFQCTKIKKERLESFLGYQKSKIVNSQFPNIGKQEWLDILEISHSWEMKDAHKVAIQQLSPIITDPIEKLELVKRYDIQDKNWRLIPIQELVKEDKRLTEADMQRIGVDMTLKICRVQGMAVEHPKTEFVSTMGRLFGSKWGSLDVYILKEFADLA